MNNRRYLELAARDRADLIEAVFFDIHAGLDLIGAKKDVRELIETIQDRFAGKRGACHSIPQSKLPVILREKYGKIASALIRVTTRLGRLPSEIVFDVKKYTAKLAALSNVPPPEEYLGIFYGKGTFERYMDFARKENSTRTAHKNKKYRKGKYC
jgi:hypothetical protein